MAITDQVQQRSDFIGTQVITRSTGKKLGVINQLWADVDQREVVVLGLRNTLVTGEQRYMDIDSIRQIGDVILVDDETALEEINTYNYSTLINNEVITETGELLGKVRGYRFDTVSGEISGLVIASIGVPLIPSQLLSTYELPVEEIASSGPDRLVVFEGAEERLNQLTVGVMERLGLGIPPWEQDEEEDYIPRTASTSNQLGSGTSAPAYTPNRRQAQEEEWDEAPQAREPVYEEEENWDDEEAPSANTPYEPDDDPWADKDDDYEPQELKIPERQKIPEYEREPDY